MNQGKHTALELMFEMKTMIKMFLILILPKVLEVSDEHERKILVGASKQFKPYRLISLFWFIAAIGTIGLLSYAELTVEYELLWIVGTAMSVFGAIGFAYEAFFQPAHIIVDRTGLRNTMLKKYIKWSNVLATFI